MMIGKSGPREPNGEVCSRCGGALNPFCASLCDEDRERLCAASRGKVFEDGTWNGARASRGFLFIIQEGCMIGHAKSADGKGFGISLFPPGSITNIVRLKDRPDTALEYESDDHAGYAAGRCSSCMVGVKEANDLRSRSVSFANALLNQALTQHENSTLFMSNVGLASSVQRVRLFFREARRLGVDMADITHENLIKILGISRVTVTRAMGTVLSEEG